MEKFRIIILVLFSIVLLSLFAVNCCKHESYKPYNNLDYALLGDWEFDTFDTDVSLIEGINKSPATN